MPCMSASIIASQKFSETGPMASTAVYTPSADGFFRINMYINQPTSGFPAVTGNLMCSNGTNALVTNPGGGENPSSSSGCFAFFQSGGSAISVSTTTSGATLAYDLYVAIEQLA